MSATAAMLREDVIAGMFHVRVETERFDCVDALTAGSIVSCTPRFLSGRRDASGTRVFGNTWIGLDWSGSLTLRIVLGPTMILRISTVCMPSSKVGVITPRARI